MTTHEGADTRERILDAAERLFGEKGYARTSLRELTGEAGANIAAVNYHFGSKEELLREVFTRRFRAVNEERFRLLDLVEREAGEAPPGGEQVLGAFLEPVFTMRRIHPGFVKLLGRIYVEPLSFRETFFRSHDFVELVRRFRGAFVGAFPEAPPAELWWGVSFMVGAVMHVFAEEEDIAGMSAGEARYEGDAEMLERLVSFTAAGIRARSGGGAA